MHFDGTTPREREKNERLWNEWCQETHKRPKLREVAERLTADIEQRKGRWPSMNNLGPRAFRVSGAPRLTHAEQREVFLILQRVWAFGLSFAQWAKKNSYVEPSDD